MNLLMKIIFAGLLIPNILFPTKAQSVSEESASLNFKNLFYYGNSDSSVKNIQPQLESHSLHEENASPEGIERIILNLPEDWAAWGKNVFNERNLPFFIGLSAVTYTALKADYQTWHPVKKLYDKNNFFRSTSETFAFVGDGKFQFGLSAGFAAYGFIFKNNKALKTAAQIAEVIFACGAAVQLLKHLTGRERPEAATVQTGKWSLLPNQIEYHKKIPSFDAFPSGHLATATATLVVIINNYPEQTWLKYVGYPVLGLVSVGLVAKGMHWWSDFPLALALGYSFADVITSKKKIKSKMDKEYIDLIPDLNIVLLESNLPGLNFHWKL
jgi:membrane-associated phospholipid phosphatase